MTLYGWGNPRYFPRLPAPTVRYFDVAPDARVLAHCHWQRDPWSHPTLLALHGLNGSSDAHYMRGLAVKAFASGMNVVRLNQRNCGNTEHLSAGLFHSGLTADARHVIEELSDVDGITAHRGGGLLARRQSRAQARRRIRRPSASISARGRGRVADSRNQRVRPGTWSVRAILYEWNFVRDLKRRIRRKAQLRPGAFDLTKLKRVRTVREFDEEYTAPHFGFLNAEDYYHRASAMRVIDRVRVPALIITSEDDPFVPAAPFRDPKVTGNPHITLHLCEHGGHCGFVGDRQGEDDGYWAEDAIVDFVSAPLLMRATLDRRQTTFG